MIFATVVFHVCGEAQAATLELTAKTRSRPDGFADLT